MDIMPIKYYEVNYIKLKLIKSPQKEGFVAKCFFPVTFDLINIIEKFQLCLIQH
jgi:hypothetical protein